MLKAISDAIQYVIDMGASVMLPIVIAVISVCIGVKVGKAIRSGLMIGVGRFQLRSSGIMNRRKRCSLRWRSLPRMRCPQAPGILTRMFTQNWSIK